MSKDFYTNENMGSHIKSPIELVISTYIKLGAVNTPGIPDFNQSTSAMGQTLFWPPTVAGWAGGRSWITPALLMERGNFARSVLYPDIDFIAKDFYSPDPKIIPSGCKKIPLRGICLHPEGIILGSGGYFFTP